MRTGPLDDPNDEPTDTSDGDDRDYDRTRTLIPRTVVTAAAWLRERAAPVVDVCPDCGDELTNGICLACLEWAGAEAERILNCEQIAAAREHVRATLARWHIEAEMSGIPF